MEMEEKKNERPKTAPACAGTAAEISRTRCIEAGQRSNREATERT